MPPRVLKLGSQFSRILMPTSGIIAGTKRSHLFAKIYLYPILEFCTQQYLIRDVVKWHRTDLYFDDVAQLCGMPANTTSEKVIEESAYAARLLFTQIVKLKLQLSPTSVVVANMRGVAPRVAQKLLSEGVAVDQVLYELSSPSRVLKLKQFEAGAEQMPGEHVRCQVWV